MRLNGIHKNWDLRRFVLAVFWALLVIPILNGHASEKENSCPETAIIVLGTRPLDANTPSLDMIRRVDRCLELHAQHPTAEIFFTGGKTAGPVPEAVMMKQLAAAKGLALGHGVLEDSSRTTEENARFTAAKIRPCVMRKTLLVTRPGHMKRAAAIFSKHKEFGKIQPEPSRISSQEIVSDLETYLSRNPNSSAQWILDKVRREAKDAEQRS